MITDKATNKTNPAFAVLHKITKGKYAINLQEEH